MTRISALNRKFILYGAALVLCGFAVYRMCFAVPQPFTNF